MSTKIIHLARHFMSLPIDGIPDEHKHLCIPSARIQADAFREKLIAEKPLLNLIGCSIADRTGYSLVFATIGIADCIVLQMQHIYPEPGYDRGVMEAAYQKHHGNLARYSNKELSAVDNLGKRGAEAIERNIDERLGERHRIEILVFGHAPTLNAIAARLMGTSIDRCRDLQFELDEGDRLVVNPGTGTYRHVPLHDKE